MVAVNFPHPDKLCKFFLWGSSNTIFAKTSL